MRQEELFWSQKARCQWLKEGDRNTSFFHSRVRNKRQRSFIHAIKTDAGQWVNDTKEIQDAGITFFENLFSSDGNVTDDELLHVIPKVITLEDSIYLAAIPDLDEVWETLLSMPTQATAGPDGFSLNFYMAARDIIKNDMLQLIKFFFVGGKMHRSISASLICLIPKVDHPSNFAQFRPISVGNVISKVISKIINNRLICFLPKLISEEQAGFVKGRDIFYHIQLAQEVITDLDKKCRGGNLVLKLDMLKAYDRLEWSFLFAVLRKFGFSYRFIEIIKWTLNNNWFTLLVNGQ